MSEAVGIPLSAPAELHAAIRALQARVAEQDKLLAERAQRIEHLLDLITLLKRKRFGRSADVLSPAQRGAGSDSGDPAGTAQG